MTTDAAQIQKTENKVCPNCVGRGWHGAYSIQKTCGICRGFGTVATDKRSA